MPMSEITPEALRVALFVDPGVKAEDDVQICRIEGGG